MDNFPSILPKWTSAAEAVVSVANPLIPPLDILTFTLLEPTHASKTSIPASIFPKWASALSNTPSIVARAELVASTSLSNVESFPSILPKWTSAAARVVSVENPVIFPLLIFTLTLLEPTHASNTSTPLSIFPKWASALSNTPSIVARAELVAVCNASNPSTYPVMAVKEASTPSLWPIKVSNLVFVAVPNPSNPSVFKLIWLADTEVAEAITRKSPLLSSFNGARALPAEFKAKTLVPLILILYIYKIF